MHRAHTVECDMAMTFALTFGNCEGHRDGPAIIYKVSLTRLLSSLPFVYYVYFLHSAVAEMYDR